FKRKGDRDSKTDGSAGLRDTISKRNSYVAGRWFSLSCRLDLRSWIACEAVGRGKAFECLGSLANLGRDHFADCRLMIADPGRSIIADSVTNSSIMGSTNWQSAIGNWQ